MLKKILILIAAIVLLLVVIEVLAILRLKSSVDPYADYWKKLPNSGVFTYVALGDSTAQGIGASRPEKGYVGLIASRIEKQTGKKVRVVNLSVTGARIEDVTNKQIPEIKNYKPDLVTIDIGGNDVAQNYNSKSFNQRFSKLAAQLPAKTYVGNMAYFGGRIKHNAQAINANAYIANAVTENDLQLIDLQVPTKKHDSLRNYASDYFHPSDRGYQYWADAYWDEIQPQL